MPHDEKPPSKKVIELVEYCKVKKIPIILSYDANAHHTLVGSTDTNGRDWNSWTAWRWEALVGEMLA